MKKYYLIFYLLLLLFACNKNEVTKGSINWYNGTLDEACNLNDTELIMIDFYTNW